MKKALLLALALIAILPISLQAQDPCDNAQIQIPVSATTDEMVAGDLFQAMMECRDGNGQLWRRLSTTSTSDTTGLNTTFTMEDEVFYGNSQLESRKTFVQNSEPEDAAYDVTQVLVRYYENGQLKFRGPSSPLTGHAASAGEQYTGGVETYYENGQLWVKGTMKEGDWDGPYESYYQSGEVSSKGMFTAGLLCGDWIVAGSNSGFDPCPPGLADGN